MPSRKNRLDKFGKNANNQATTTEQEVATPQPTTEEVTMPATRSRSNNTATAEPTTLTFEFEKETPGTLRFKEAGDKDNHVIGTLYVKKGKLGNVSASSSLSVTIAVA